MLINNIKNIYITRLINISFIIMLILEFTTFYYIIEHFNDQEKLFVTYKIGSINMRDLMFLNDIPQKEEIIKSAKTLYTIKRGRRVIKYLKYKNSYYIYFYNFRFSKLFKDKEPIIYSKTKIYLIFTVITALIVILWYIIIKKISPIKILQQNMIYLSNEDFNKIVSIDSKDEIGLLSKEIQKSAKKLKDIKSSREIFIRNIMHELKTPITRGKLALELEPVNRDILRDVFYRTQSLIKEFSSVENFISFKNLNFKEYSIVDIVDNSIDICMCEIKNISLNISHFKIKADFYYLSIAFKNLIDNGIKYSTDNKIDIVTKNNSIYFINSGYGLPYSFGVYKEPFFDNQNQKFSIGLYIANSIIKHHNFTLKYRYLNKKVYFIVTFPEYSKA